MKRKYEMDDDEAVECSVCLEPLSPPIYQCINGHLACGSCSEDLRGEECPHCDAMPFAHTRNLAMEDVINSLWTACHHAPHGCKEVVKLTDRESHADKACEYRILRCPVDACTVAARKPEISEHLKSAHGATAVHLSPTTRSERFRMSLGNSRRYFLITADKELLLLHAFRDGESMSLEDRFLVHGRRHSVSVFYVSSFGNDPLRYNLRVSAMGEEGARSVLSFEASVLLHHRYTDWARNWNHLDEVSPEVKNYVVLPNVKPGAELDLELSLL